MSVSFCNFAIAVPIMANMLRYALLAAVPGLYIFCVKMIDEIDEAATIVRCVSSNYRDSVFDFLTFIFWFLS